MSNQTRTLEIGTISSGTLRPQDVIPALWDVLNYVSAERAAAIAAEYPEFFDKWSTGETCVVTIAEYDDNGTWTGVAGPYDEHDETAGYLWDALCDTLQEFAPAGCYVGSHEGDGADIGVWPESDELPDYLGSDF